MRSRLAVAFAILAVTLGVVFFAARVLALSGPLRDHELAELERQAYGVASSVAQARRSDEDVEDRHLRAVIDEDAKALIRVPGRPETLVVGPHFHGPTGLAGPRADDLSMEAEVDGVHVVVMQHDDVVRHMLFSNTQALLLTLLGSVLLAGAAGYLLARMLSRPFRRLAQAAGALGRGGFHLELPDSAMPEVRAIGQALEASAARVEERLHRERQLAEHASHALRTPLTGLRLEVEELAGRQDLPADVRRAMSCSLSRIEQLDAVTDELVTLARQGSLATGAELPLWEVAAVVGQRWNKELARDDRWLTVETEGALATTYSPGPIEQILELLLFCVVDRSRGSVRLVFRGEPDGLLQIVVEAERPVRGTVCTDGDCGQLVRARTIAGALGGRITGEAPDTGVRVLLPRR